MNSSHLSHNLALRRSFLRSSMWLPMGAMGLLTRPRVFAWNLPQMQLLMQSRFGSAAGERMQAWKSLLEQQQGKPLQQQLNAVNDFWNVQLLSAGDKQLWKSEDHWATPLESLGKGAGDCEDYVIGKYFSLHKLGVPTRQMRLIYVRARLGGVGSTRSVAHMVLGFYVSAQSDPWVLDNLVGSIQRASQRRDLTPVLSFDAEGIYVDGARSASSERINRWQNLLARMRQEGFDV